MMYTTKKRNKGYSLVEVLVAISVLLVALVGPLTIASSGLKRANFAKEQTLAIFLAQEGMEAVVKLREDSALAATSFDNLSEVWTGTFGAISSRCVVGSSNYCGVSIAEDGTVNSNSIYQCNATNCLIKHLSTARVPYRQGSSVTGTDTIFTRQIQVTVSGSSYAQVVSTVSWGPAASDRVVVETYVYNTYYEP
jgi:prepilin-type N-terminal cleavage/methylation domain-containing protein